MRPRVKICGLTRPEDAAFAVVLGATHVGCVMVPASPRCATSEQARRVFEAAGEKVSCVLVMVNEERDAVLDLAGAVGTTHVQLHRVAEEDARFLEERGLTVYRVHEVERDARTLPPLVPEPREDRPAVLDVGGGGSGTPFSWDVLGRRAPHATFIAGGINPENISALMSHHPYGVDLSSGVELEPGIKDHSRLKLFFENLEKSL